jgi:Phosphoserine phosphatase RsbU, N-terminal domain/GAF domain
VNEGGGPRVGPFRAAYASALAAYLHDPSERSLRAAYELGREAVKRPLSVLDLAVAHHQAMLAASAGVYGSEETQQLIRAAGDFFLESLSSFEMVQRGFGEVREAARLERRQTEMSRQLSSFLADASLALTASDSLGEMLRLVAEQARELLGAECCLATVAAEGRPRIAEGASYSNRRWTARVQWFDLFAAYEFIRRSGGAVRITGEQLADMTQFTTAAGDAPLRGWLAAPLTALDGSGMGAIQLFDKQEGEFTEDDEAALLHLAQMASAAVERAQLYQDRS